MTTTINVYPSTLPGEPIETHVVERGTLHDWLTVNCPSYQAGGEQPIAVFVGGAQVSPADWHLLDMADGLEIEIRPLARGLETTTLVIIAIVAAVAVSVLLMPKIPKPGNQGKSIKEASLTANNPRLNGVIPEIAGRHKIFPDYLTQPRTVFSDDGKKQITSAFLCIGVGEFDIDPDEIYLGDTPLSTLGDEVTYRIYQPGEAIQNLDGLTWHNLSEIGATRSSAGLKLLSQDGTASSVTGTVAPKLSYAAVNSTFSVNGDSVTLVADYASIADLVAAINAGLGFGSTLQASSVVVGGVSVLKITETSEPYLGGVTLAGSYLDVFGGPVTQVNGEETGGVWAGPFRLTPGPEPIYFIEFDVFLPSGIGVMSDEGGVSSITRHIQMEYRINGGAWQPGTNITITGGNRDQYGLTSFRPFFGFSYTNVDVRLRRVEKEDTGAKALDKIEWYGCRCVPTPSPVSYPGITTMAIKINGSDRISASSENKINLIATRKLNSTATRSIEAWVRHVCADIGYDTSDIDSDELARLGAIWNARSDYFDYVFNEQETVREAITTALRTGYAELTIDDGRIRPVRDEPRSMFEQMYTPQNMTSPLVRQFVSYDPDDYDGVDVEYLDAVTWATETVQCRLPGDVGLRVRKIQADGITDRTKAWRLGMRQRRMDAYRRRAYSFSTEWDALNSRYLSYCALSDDVPGYGQSAVLLSTASVTGGLVLTVSEPLTWANGASHVVALRRPDGTLSGPHAATRVDDDQVQIAGPLDFAPILGGASDPTHVLFGTTTSWSYPVLITEISPSGDTVDVSAVNYDARVYADDDNAPT